MPQRIRQISLLLVCGLAGVSVSACMPKQKPREKQRTLLPPTVVEDAAFADNYSLHDVDCNPNERRILGEQEFYTWNGSQSVTSTFDFRDVRAGLGLSGPGVQATLYGLHQKSECDSSLANCDDAKVVSQSRSLPICPSGQIYPRTSYEGVALASMMGLQTAERFYAGLDRRKQLEQARLLVLPKVEKVSRSNPDRRTVTTDNLIYTPSFSGDPAFVVFPKSKQVVKQGLWTDVNLWEIPWALSHEYGHHVLRQHTGLRTIGGSQAFGQPLFDPKTVLGQEQGFDLTTQSRSVGDKEVWGAINEGFADLFAYYALGAKPGLTANVDCFEDSRDTAADQFADGRRKDFDRVYEAAFFSTRKQSRGGCGNADLQSIHSLGAVIAHSLDQLLVAGGITSREQRANWLLRWADSLGKTVTNANSGSLDLEELLALGWQEAAPSGQLSNEQCDSLAETFSAYAKGDAAQRLGCD